MHSHMCLKTDHYFFSVTWHQIYSEIVFNLWKSMFMATNIWLVNWTSRHGRLINKSSGITTITLHKNIDVIVRM
jgi:hypothetical protein